MLTCPKNVKTLLWGLIRWEGWHRWKLIWIARGHFGWRIECECKVCGAREERGGVNDELLIRVGYDIEKLRGQMPRPGNSILVEEGNEHAK